MIRVLAFIVALICAAPAIAQPLPANLDKQNAIVIDTTKGRIVFKLRTDLAPKHAERIKQLAREGYYNNVPFHRVMDGFMAQTGDGQNFNGTGGSKYPNLKAEFSSVPFTRGIVGMARRGDSVDTANSQFFFMFADAPSLNGQYTVIGEVVSGMDVVDKLKKAPAGSRGGEVTSSERRGAASQTADRICSGAAAHVIDLCAGRTGAGQYHPRRVREVEDLLETAAGVARQPGYRHHGDRKF